MGQLVSLLLDENFINDLIIGDIHAPMNKVSDIFKLMDNNEIVSGWSIFHGYKHPIVVFPPTYLDGWNSIKSFVNTLRHQTILVSFPKKIENQSNDRPWDNWDNYNWEHLFTDNAMKFSGDLEILDISNLPKIRGIGYDESERLQKFLDVEEKKGEYSGIFHPFQVLSDLYVVAEDANGSIIAVAGTHYETPSSVQLGNIYVKDKYRKQGLGKAITSAVTLSILRSHRVPTLFVNDQNLDARRLYEEIGFEIFNQYEFYQGTLK